jgi:hypothetical protein
MRDEQVNDASAKKPKVKNYVLVARKLAKKRNFKIKHPKHIIPSSGR